MPLELVDGDAQHLMTSSATQAGRVFLFLLATALTMGLQSAFVLLPSTP